MVECTGFEIRSKSSNGAGFGGVVGNPWSKPRELLRGGAAKGLVNRVVAGPVGGAGHDGSAARFRGDARPP